MEGSDRSAVTAAMTELATAERGWVDITPDDVDPPAPTSVWGRISGRGPSVPRITWTAPHRTRSRLSPAELGIEHAAGTKSLERLAGEGHHLPPGWRRLQDHPMRGLVLQPPAEAADEDVLAWALGAVHLLTGWPIEGPWRVQIFEGR